MSGSTGRVPPTGTDLPEASGGVLSTSETILAASVTEGVNPRDRFRLISRSSDAPPIPPSAALMVPPPLRAVPASSKTGPVSDDDNVVVTLSRELLPHDSPWRSVMAHLDKLDFDPREGFSVQQKDALLTFIADHPVLRGKQLSEGARLLAGARHVLRQLLALNEGHAVFMRHSPAERALLYAIHYAFDFASDQLIRFENHGSLIHFTTPFKSPAVSHVRIFLESPEHFPEVIAKVESYPRHPENFELIQIDFQGTREEQRRLQEILGEYVGVMEDDIRADYRFKKRGSNLEGVKVSVNLGKAEFVEEAHQREAIPFPKVQSKDLTPEEIRRLRFQDPVVNLDDLRAMADHWNLVLDSPTPEAWNRLIRRMERVFAWDRTHLSGENRASYGCTLALSFVRLVVVRSIVRHSAQIPETALPIFEKEFLGEGMIHKLWFLGEDSIEERHDYFNSMLVNCLEQLIRHDPSQLANADIPLLHRELKNQIVRWHEFVMQMIQHETWPVGNVLSHEEALKQLYDNLPHRFVRYNGTATQYALVTANSPRREHPSLRFLRGWINQVGGYALSGVGAFVGTGAYPEEFHETVALHEVVELEGRGHGYACYYQLNKLFKEDPALFARYIEFEATHHPLYFRGIDGFFDREIKGRQINGWLSVGIKYFEALCEQFPVPEAEELIRAARGAETEEKSSRGRLNDYQREWASAVIGALVDEWHKNAGWLNSLVSRDGWRQAVTPLANKLSRVIDLDFVSPDTVTAMAQILIGEIQKIRHLGFRGNEIVILGLSKISADEIERLLTTYGSLSVVERAIVASTSRSIEDEVRSLLASTQGVGYRKGGGGASVGTLVAPSFDKEQDDVSKAQDDNSVGLTTGLTQGPLALRNEEMQSDLGSVESQLLFNIVGAEIQAGIESPAFSIIGAEAGEIKVQEGGVQDLSSSRHGSLRFPSFGTGLSPIARSTPLLFLAKI